MTSIKHLRNRLREDFGFQTFRPGQSEACRAAMEGRDTLILMPTGSGKSLCYQLPGLALEGVTVVVSPLISLAEDQAKHIRELGCQAAILNSSKSAKQLREFHQDIQSGKAEFVFTTPERLQQSDLCQLLSEVGVDLFVIDEAHCVCQWGHDFRPDYLCLHYARERLGNPPTLAMTATASPQAIDQIVRSLKLCDPAIVATGTLRPNLRLSVMPSSGDVEKERQLRALLCDGSDLIANEPAIVYCATINTVERLHSQLANLRMPTLAYHGRMKKAARIASQEAFTNGPPAVMFATNAFGLGIDKPNIRRVIHHDIPGSLEAYYQEFGRAGRDGELAACTLLYDREDLRLQKLFAGGSLDSSQLRTAHHTLIQGAHRYGDETGSVALKDLKPISPLGTQTLKNCFQHLASAGLMAPSGRGRWTCLADKIDHEATDRLADESRLRSEHRRIALDQIVQYAESTECRWLRIANHFATQDEQVASACCCDNCQTHAINVA